MVKADTGALALVLPAVVPTVPGNLGVRQYLGERFHVETIVASHDPERIFFSENTSIGEVLLVCRRWADSAPKPPTRIVNLARNPSTPVEALDTAARIEVQLPLDASFTTQTVDADRIERGDWYAVNFLSPFLVNTYQKLCEEPLGAAPCVPMSELAEVGPEGRRIRDTYMPSEMPTASGRRALWHHKTDVTTSMHTATDVHIEPKSSRPHLADSYWGQRSRFLLPHRLRLNTARLAAVILPEPAVGSLWTPCRTKHEEAATAEALCLYLNSSLGLMALLGGRGNRVPSYPAFSIDALRAIPMPNLDELGSGVRDFLAARFKWLQDMALLPLPRMNEDPVRRQIDDAVTDALGLDAEWVARIRRELAREPSITNRRYGT